MRVSRTTPFSRALSLAGLQSSVRERATTSTHGWGQWTRTATAVPPRRTDITAAAYASKDFFLTKYLPSVAAKKCTEEGRGIGTRSPHDDRLSAARGEVDTMLMLLHHHRVPYLQSLLRVHHPQFTEQRVAALRRCIAGGLDSSAYSMSGWDRALNAITLLLGQHQAFNTFPPPAGRGGRKGVVMMTITIDGAFWDAPPSFEAVRRMCRVLAEECHRGVWWAGATTSAKSTTNELLRMHCVEMERTTRGDDETTQCGDGGNTLDLTLHAAHRSSGIGGVPPLPQTPILLQSSVGRGLLLLMSLLFVLPRGGGCHPTSTSAHHHHNHPTVGTVKLVGSSVAIHSKGSHHHDHSSCGGSSTTSPPRTIQIISMGSTAAGQGSSAARRRKGSTMSLSMLSQFLLSGDHQLGLSLFNDQLERWAHRRTTLMREIQQFNTMQKKKMMPRPHFLSAWRRNLRSDWVRALKVMPIAVLLAAASPVDEDTNDVELHRLFHKWSYAFFSECFEEKSTSTTTMRACANDEDSVFHAGEWARMSQWLRRSTVEAIRHTGTALLGLHRVRSIIPFLKPPPPPSMKCGSNGRGRGVVSAAWLEAMCMADPQRAFRVLSALVKEEDRTPNIIIQLRTARALCDALVALCLAGSGDDVAIPVDMLLPSVVVEIKKGKTLRSAFEVHYHPAVVAPLLNQKQQQSGAEAAADDAADSNSAFSLCTYNFAAAAAMIILRARRRANSSKKDGAREAPLVVFSSPHAMIVYKPPRIPMVSPLMPPVTNDGATTGSSDEGDEDDCGLSAHQSVVHTIADYAASKGLRCVCSSIAQCGIVNRIDAPASGLVIAAPPQSTAQRTEAPLCAPRAALLVHHTIHKEYLVIVVGVGQSQIDPEGAISSFSSAAIPTTDGSGSDTGEEPLDDEQSNHDLTESSMGSLMGAAFGDSESPRHTAITTYKVLEFFPHRDAALVRACIDASGHRHQIRRHFASIGCPIYGDRQYGSGRGEHSDNNDDRNNYLRCDADGTRLQRLALHAERIVFPRKFSHTGVGEEKQEATHHHHRGGLGVVGATEIVCSLPRDMAGAVAILRRERAVSKRSPRRLTTPV